MKAARLRLRWSKLRLIKAMRADAAERGRVLPGDASLLRELAYWENGHRQPDEDTQATFCRIYGATPDELGFAEPQPDESTGMLSEELVTRLETARRVDADLVTLLHEETNNIRLRDRRLGAVALADSMNAHLRHVDELLRYSVFHTDRASLAAVLADASALAGWQAIDTGSLRDAWTHFERAKAAAREAEHAPLLAFATAEQAYVLLDLDRTGDALALIQHAHQANRRKVPPLMRSWLHAAEAEANAVLGDGSAALRLMDAAAGELPTDGHDPELPFLALNLAHLARWRGSCLVHLGDADAIDDLTAGLAGMDGTFTRAEAGLRCDLGAALLARGEKDEARTHLERARQLVTVVGSVRQRRRLDRLFRSV